MSDPWTDLARRDAATPATYRRRRLVLVLIVCAIATAVMAIQEGAIDRSSVDTPSVSRDPLSDACPAGDHDGC